MNRIVHRRCPFCGQDNHAGAPTAYGNAVWPIKACAGCGFVYTEHAPVYERLMDEFAWEKTSHIESERRTAKHPIRQALSQKMKGFRQKVLKRDKLPRLVRERVTAGHVLDIGCGGGGVLSRLGPEYIPHGIEISRALAQRAAETLASRHGTVIHDAALHGLARFPPGYFSGVILSAFLEHEIEPKALLAGVLRVLAAGGCGIIKVPNYASLNRVIHGSTWCGFRLPDHVNYFTPSSLARMCRQAGFEIDRFRLTDRHCFSDNLWIVIRKSA
ncbi:MAG: class I SAM-dependent methyltransferase [Betaproteobacteria bacterium]|nr:class I SAM-dependent methyltransferase [Betaproteobacteria bacterium]